MNSVKSHSQTDSRPALAPRSNQPRRWLGRGLIGLLLVLVFLGAAGAIYQVVASARDARDFPPTPIYRRCKAPNSKRSPIRPGTPT